MIKLELQSLRDLENFLYSPAISQRSDLDGLHWRLSDFQQSRGVLIGQLIDESRVAENIFPKSQTSDILHGNLAGRLGVRSSGVNTDVNGKFIRSMFETYKLSPALRHFLNDSCRLLELLTSVLAKRYPHIKLGQESLSGYIIKVMRAGENIDFDTSYILELYELWNDYKHRSTRGTHATLWQYENGAIEKPKLYPPNLKKQLVILKDIEIDDLITQTTEQILSFSKYLLKE